MSEPRNWRRGFTIIELLVVLAIIIMLMAILMPVLRAVRLKARDAQCMNNLKQLGNAMKMYETQFRCLPPAIAQLPAANNPNVFPDWLTNDSLNTASGAPGFTGAPQTGRLYPFYGNPELVLCPLDNVNGNGRFSYGMPVAAGMKHTAIASKPGDNLLLIQVDPFILSQFRNGGFYGSFLPTDMHGGAAGSLFMDFHAELKDWTQYAGTPTVPRAVGLMPYAQDIFIAPYGYNRAASGDFATYPENAPD